MTTPNATCPRCGAPDAGEFCARCAGRFLLVAAGDSTEGGGGVEKALTSPAWAYELGSELGRGSMGVVYRARHRTLNRQVAIKQILLNRFAGDAARRRFMAEAELAAQLDHPNIIPVYEVGETAAGPFFAMKLVEGGTLAARLEAVGSGASVLRMDIEESVRLLARVARAVHHAHERGVLHRDLKPGNILLDDQGEPYVADFGLARRLDSQSSLTLPDSPLGTPAYMSPEQARGSTAPTVASDVWGLGAILFQLLTGRPPFTGTTALEVMRHVQEREPDWPADSPGSGPTRDPIPADLRTICLKCLNKEPSNRYASARALAEDLDHWLRGEPIVARPTSWIERAARWVRRHPALATMAAFALASLIAGAVGVTSQWQRAEAAQQRTLRANRELLELLNRREHERAEAYFQAGDATRGVALLARLLRRDPSFQPAAERLAAALIRRPFAVPEREFPIIDATVLAVSQHVDGLRFVGGSNLVEVRLWDASSGTPASPVFRRIGRQPFPAFSPDSTIVAVVATNATVELRSASDGRLLDAPLAASAVQPAAVCALRFSRDGTRLLTATTNGEVRLWHVRDATPVARPLSAGEAVRDADLDPDGKTVAACTWSRKIIVWDTDSGAERFRVDYEPAAVRYLRWSHDGRHLATLCGMRQVNWIHAQSGIVERSWTAPEDAVSIACGRSDDTVMVQCARVTLLWNASTGLLAAEPIHRRAAGLSDLPPGPDRFLAVSDNGRVRSMRRRTPPAAGVLNHGPALATVHYAPDGRSLLTVGTNGVVGYWDAGSLTPIREPAPTGGIVLAADLANDTLLVSSNATCWLASIKTGKPMSARFEDDAPIHAGAMRPDRNRIALAKRLATSPKPNSVSVWDVPGAQRLWSDESYPYRVNGITYAPDGSKFAARWGTYVSYLQGETSSVTNLAHRGFVEHMVFLPDSAGLLTSPGDFTVRGWALGAGHTNFTLPHEGFVGKFAIDPLARRLAAITDVGQVRVHLWDLHARARIGEALEQSSNTVCVAFSPDGRHLAAGAIDGSVRVWDAGTGLPVSESLPTGPAATSVCFSPAGNQLAIASEDGLVRVWDLPELSSGEAGWLPSVAEALAGLRATATDIFELTPWSSAQEGLDRARGVATNKWIGTIVPQPGVRP